MIKYGLISKVDADVLERTLNLIMSDFSYDTDIYTCQVGIFDGETDRGINKFITMTGRRNFHTAIDNNKDKEVLLPFPDCKMIIGNSHEVYNQIPDESLHLCFIDSCHCLSCVISDFFLYAPKIKKGAYLAFHDTAAHIKPFKDFQHGDKDNPDAFIAVRKALNKIGLLDDNNSGESTIRYYKQQLDNWELVFDNADVNDEAGGICVFKKLY